MKSRRLIVLGAWIMILLISGDVWSYLFLADAKNQATAALDDAGVCERLAKQIITLQSKPVVAATTFQGQEELSARIEATARQFGMTGDNLAAIDPETAIRVADTVYMQKPTVIQLRQVTLGQLISLICELSKGDDGLKITSLRLSVPPQNQDGNLWSAEVTVAYLIYSPPPQQENHAQPS